MANVPLDVYGRHMDSSGLRNTVAANVQQAREKSGLTLKQLAEATEIPRTTLFYRLRGKRPFDVDQLEKIAPVLGCKPEQFYRTQDAS